MHFSTPRSEQFGLRVRPSGCGRRKPFNAGTPAASKLVSRPVSARLPSCDRYIKSSPVIAGSIGSTSCPSLGLIPPPSALAYRQTLRRRRHPNPQRPTLPGIQPRVLRLARSAGSAVCASLVPHLEIPWSATLTWSSGRQPRDSNETHLTNARGLPRKQR